MKTQPVLVPPPPKPPARAATAGASPDPRRHVRGSHHSTFLGEVYHEVSQVIWPDRRTVIAYSAVVTALLFAFSAAVFLSNGAASAVMRNIGVD